MIGTAINVGAITLGSMIGVGIGSRLTEEVQTTVVDGLGIVCTLIGIKMGLETQNVLIPLGAILLGAVVGEITGIQNGLELAGNRLQRAFSKGGPSRISEAFITASLVFCIGPMAILGSIQDGLRGDFQLLAIKSMLDGFASIAFAATLGWGVVLSAVSILLMQGSITLFAATLDRFLTQPMITEMSAVGGLIIIAIGIKLLKLKEIRIASFLPALVIAPAIVALIPVIRSLFD
jgi:uncharacterized membrane protein YqgA involved in biofilm formation